MLLAERMFTGWLREDVVSNLHIGTMFIPAPFWTGEKMTWETGVAVFLQWDYTCSSAAILLWATSQYLEATSSVGKSKGISLLETIGQALLHAVLAGPAAAAAFLLQERDTTLAAGFVESKGVKQQ